MADSKRPGYLHGAAILATTAIAVKLIGAVFKLPLFNLLGDEGTGHFQITYQIFTLLLTISYSGIPVALSRLISAAAATGRNRQVNRYFSSALPAFAIVGVVFSLAMFIFAGNLAGFMEDPDTVLGIRVLSPAVFLCCILSVYEGYAQGHGDMIPTAIKQLLEVTCKLIFGMSVAWLLIRRGEDSPTAAAGAITGVVVGLALTLPILIIYKRRKKYPVAIEGDGAPDGRARTLASVIRVSIPITLGASFMTVMTILDSKIVLLRLASGLGVTKPEAVAMLGIYSKGQALFNLPPSLVVPVTVSIIPAISAAIAASRNHEPREITESSMKLVNLIAMPAGIGIFVLSAPIFGALFGGGETGARILSILGIASFFACAQLMTTAVLQANGFERVPMITYPIGGLAQIVLDWVLVGNPNIGIVGSPLGTLACYLTITVLNLAIIKRRVPDPPRLLRVFLRPAAIAAVMGVCAWAVYGLIEKLVIPSLGEGRLMLAAYLGVTIVIAAIIYAVLIIVTRTVTRDDLKLIPKGEKIANFLKIK